MEEIKIDNEKLYEENQKLEKINENLLNKQKCICDIGLERYNLVIEQQKKDAENLRGRFNGLFKELEQYRKKNIELKNELKNLQEESNILYSQSEFHEEGYIITTKTKKSFEEDIRKLNENLKKLQKENEYLKSTLHINNINWC